MSRPFAGTEWKVLEEKCLGCGESLIAHVSRVQYGYPWVEYVLCLSCGMRVV